MTKLEKLLNTLLQRGWKPRGYNDIKKITVENNKNVKQKVIHLRPGIGVDTETLTRFICVKESGLWQFVCENRKRGYTMPQGWIKNPKICDEGIESVEKECNQNSYEYYIIESALKEESELEQFLLQNIKIDEDTK